MNGRQTALWTIPADNLRDCKGLKAGNYSSSFQDYCWPDAHINSPNKTSTHYGQAGKCSSVSQNYKPMKDSHLGSFCKTRPKHSNGHCFFSARQGPCIQMDTVSFA